MPIMRKRLYEIVEHAKDGDKVSAVYDAVMLVAIMLSLIPLMFAQDYPIFHIIEMVTVALFILDYILRWITADFRLKKGGWSFLLYPVTIWAIVDQLSILPGLNVIGRGFNVFRVTRLLRLLRLLRAIRYSEKIKALGRVIRKEKGVLITVLCIAFFYIYVTALIIFSTEPHVNPETGATTFSSFFDALYWATVTLTTVGYGDIIPVTRLGRFIGMLSSLFGIAVIALPTGVITASYLEELRASIKKSNKEKGSEKQAESKPESEPDQQPANE